MTENGEHSRLIAQSLAGPLPPWHIEFTSLGITALDRLAREPFDVVLVDYNLPNMNGLNLVREIFARQVDVAVIFLSAFANEQMAAEAIRSGADECIQRSELMYSSLDRVVQKWVENQKLRRQVRATQNELIQRERQAALTQLSLTLRHEINNPLAALCGYTELLLAEVKDQPDLRRRVQQIYDEAMRIRDVVRKTEHVRDELQEYQPGLKMIKLPEPGELPSKPIPKSNP